MFVNFKKKKNHGVYPAPLLPQTPFVEENFFLKKRCSNGVEQLGRKNGAGFTLIEIIIAIFILSFAIVGIFTAFSIVLILTSDAVDRLTATYLTQEGIEIVRNIRDTNWLNMDLHPDLGYTWDRELTGCDISGNPLGGCRADYKTGTGDTGEFPIYLWAGTDVDYLYINNENGFYDYNKTNLSTATKFKRRIIITPLADTDVEGKSDHILKVIVETSWDRKATILNDLVMAGSADPADSSKCNPSNCVTAEETLYNWYNYNSQ